MTQLLSRPTGVGPLRVRWLGRVRYRDAHALQRALFERKEGEYLLLLEHPHVYTLGVRAKAEHLLAEPAEVGAELVRTDRGGDITYHGPGQLVGYPIITVEMRPDAVPLHVHRIEQLVIDVLSDLGLPGCGRLEGYPGVWVDPGGDDPRKICAIGVRVSRGRSMHGFALNVAPDKAMFGHIVPCGISDKRVTSLHEEGVEVTMTEVVDSVARLAGPAFGLGPDCERQDATDPDASRSRTEDERHEAVRHEAVGTDSARPGASGSVAVRLGRPLDRRLAAAGVDPSGGVQISARKPSWLRVGAHIGPEYAALKRSMRELDLVTVCEEAGCPNIFECWAAGTATFMINGERCTRACGFCLVDTRHPLALDPGEPDRVADAVERMGLAHVVVTAVARDDLPDGGAAAFAATIATVRRRRPATTIEVLIPDCKGDAEALGVIFDARPDILNHNVETVVRLQRAVRPSASYARSLSVLARAKRAGLTTKSGIILGMGETAPEVLGAMADVRAVGVDILTLGQYLRPTSAHLPVARWWTPEEFEELRVAAVAMGFAHVQASPLTRSSYHAREAATAAADVGGPMVRPAAART